VSSDGYNFKQLSAAIIALSVEKMWEAARLEWRLLQVYEADEPDTCLCGHFPIIEVCVLKNIKNGRLTEVGNVCVKRFIGIRSDKIFASVKKIRRDLDKASNTETIELMFQQRLISSWERTFSFETMRKRNLSDRQLAKRREINRKILNNLVRAKI
jgi:hypothetical protein